MNKETIEIKSIDILGFSDNLIGIRDDAIKILITPVQGLGLSVLNILSPKNTIFWDVGIYSKLEADLYDFYYLLRDKEQSYDRYIGECRKELPDISMFSIFHHNWRYLSVYGVDSDICEVNVRSLSGRQIPIMVKEDQCEKIVSYFESQCACSSFNSYSSFDENSIVAVDSSYRRSEYFEALSKPLFSICSSNFEGISIKLEEILKKGVEDIPGCFFNPGALSLTAPDNLNGFDAADYIQLLKLRIDVLGKYSPKHVIEKSIQSVIGDWKSVGIDEAVVMMEKILEDLYVKYPFINKGLGELDK